MILARAGRWKIELLPGFALEAWYDKDGGWTFVLGPIGIWHDA
jgi:hypothetical protein